MLNFEFCTEAERRETAGIERRRAQDEERKKRIFGPKAKIFIDHAALNDQIRDKKKRDQEERARDAIFEEQIRQFAIMAKELEEKEKLERKKQMQEINQFRLTFQKKEDRREADINNTKTIPGRVFDDDPRCGMSSLQKFAGEDTYEQERRKIQKEQTRVWLDQQMDEKERAEKERIQAEDAYREATTARDQQVRQLAKLEMECRHRLSLACMDYNKALADERDRLRRLNRKEEEQDAMAHKYNVMNSDMLLETSDSKAKQGKIERGVLLEELKHLAREAQDRRNMEKRQEREYYEYVNGVQMTIATIDADLARKKKQLNKTIMEENLAMSKEQKSRNQFLKKVVYTNCPTEEYYDQFNKDAR